MSWWLVPAGTKTDRVALRNVNNTLDKPYRISEQIHQLTQQTYRQLQEVNCHEYVHIWGAKSGENNRKNWLKLQRGDKIIFYTQGRYMYLGTVYTKEHNYNLARQVWTPIDEQGEVFEYIYFLIDLQKIDIEGNQFNNLLGYDGSVQEDLIL
jgi:hypothetical protein